MEELGHEKHLVRQKAHDQLKKKISDDCELEEAAIQLIEMLSSDEWETIYGGLIGASELIGTRWSTPELSNSVSEKAEQLIKHPEFRVRNALGLALASQAKIQGLNIYLTTKPFLFQRIFECFEPIQADNALVNESILKGGSGWQNLETAMRTLQGLMNCFKGSFDSQIDSEFWEALDGACEHSNRFVREIGQFLCADLSEAVSQTKLTEITPKLLDYIAAGLSDNWSEVRFAASTAIRSFISVEGVLNEALIIPRMCINRYYVAEGVRTYSEETWVEYCGDQGKQIVARNAPDVIEFYLHESAADNQAVREAACLSISELASKVSEFAHDIISLYVSDMLGGLIDCCKDESWCVRDAASEACAEFVGHFPDACISRLSELKELWLAHTTDNIASVRDNSAFAVVKALKVYKNTPHDFTREVFEYLETNIRKVEDEREYAENHKETYSNEEMYSCGSLGPKLKRGGGCSDHGFTREKRPWEFTESCVFLLKWLSEIEKEQVAFFIESVADVVRREDYPAAPYMKRTVWVSMPVIAENIGKVLFKNNSEWILHELFKDVKDFNETVSFPAEECVRFLSKFLGPNIFKGRVEMLNPNYTPILIEVLNQEFKA